jgi:hypothetical protein
MIKQSLINSLNKVFERKTFRYSGAVLPFAEYSSEPEIEFGYTLKIVNQKKMIRIGEWVDYLFLDIYIKNYTGPFSILFNGLYNTDSFKLLMKNNLNGLFSKMGLPNEFYVDINNIYLDENGI